MNEWEAKYKALLAGIDNKDYVDNAELLVSKAIDLSASSHVSFEDALRAMLQVIGIFRDKINE